MTNARQPERFINVPRAIADRTVWNKDYMLREFDLLGDDAFELFAVASVGGGLADEFSCNVAWNRSCNWGEGRKII